MLGYSSSPKSGVSRALSIHGFQITTNESRLVPECAIRKDLRAYQYPGSCISAHASFGPTRHSWWCVLAACAGISDPSTRWSSQLHVLLGKLHHRESINDSSLETISFGCKSSHLINKRTTMQACDLATSNVRNFQVRMQQQIEWECKFFAGIVDANVEVELFLS